ncbi:cyclase family protein [Paenibacillus naphthalenovorans]|uniref:cyclase family protein n=1 Tax=Paenibacillus naphthalenovorans TaxID=162209 RepID=UPI0008801199|nr:cyclase family protein [Paenibacillus naphthalenovorans]SDJ78659.1 Kynurenine formamidase [Paenibacillus naphthalenovorans]
MTQPSSGSAESAVSSARQLSSLLGRMQIVDLSHTLEEDMPIYPTHSRYYHTLWDSFATGSRALLYQLVINEHCGTHIDATAHFMPEDHPEHLYMADTPLARCAGRALTLDLSYFQDTDLVTTEIIRQWEQAHYAIEPGDIVNFRFGWDRYWQPRSVSRAYSKSWPGLSGEAAEYLVSKQIKAVGCDVLAIDSSYAENSPAHYALLGNGINIIENLTRLDEIVGESYMIAFPLKIKQGSGSPIRAVAFK